ncbi:MAG: sulfurtransferase-like selenium metabolism protein YedF [Bacteroidetes bacterium]|nr:sulfurtransferase-like selenium metabolism protein YedF [Bacteroidota bacterium]
MKTIDVKGMKCPMPLIETKKALKEIGKEESLRIIIDNETSVKNVTHYLEDNNLPVEKKQDGKIFELIVNKTGDESYETCNAEAYCEVPAEKDKSFVVMLAKDYLGEGEHELGHALVGSMLNTIKAMEVLPEKIIFMNSGINLVTKGSLFLPLLKELETMGVTIITCGTCLDYYGKMDDLEIGRISNMADIMESMLTVGKVINI